MNNYIYKNKSFDYFNHSYNSTFTNERRVEIPLLREFMLRHKSFIEIGCVSPYYFESDHLVYDLTDPHSRAVNVDAEHLDLADNILSISTIEHFGVGDCGNPVELGKAINFLKKIISTNFKYLITWPLGYNLELDHFVYNNISIANYVCRDNNTNYTWKQKSIEELTNTDKTYGTFSCANSICIIENSI